MAWVQLALGLGVLMAMVAPWLRSWSWPLAGANENREPRSRAAAMLDPLDPRRLPCRSRQPFALDPFCEGYVLREAIWTLVIH